MAAPLPLKDNIRSWGASKGQLVIPARLRRKYRIEPGTKVIFGERDHEILIRPVTKEYVRSVCGLFRSDTPATAMLLRKRAKDKERGEAKLARRGWIEKSERGQHRQLSPRMGQESGD